MTYMQPLRCNELQFRSLRKELDSFFQNVIYYSAANTLGHPSHKHQDWFDENDEGIKRLLEENHRLHKADLDDTSSVSKKAAYNNAC